MAEAGSGFLMSLRRLGFLRFDFEDTVHQHAVTREGAKVGIVTCFCWGDELYAVGLTGLHEVHLLKDVGGFRDVAFSHAIWITKHGHRSTKHFVFRAYFADDDVVGLRNGALRIVKSKLYFGARFYGQSLGVISQCGCGIRAWFEHDFFNVVGAERSDGTNSEEGE